MAVWAFVGMNKIEFNPRKSRHIKYLEKRIVELHEEIFDEALFVATQTIHYTDDVYNMTNDELTRKRRIIQTKILLQKKYRRRLNLLNL